MVSSRIAGSEVVHGWATAAFRADRPKAQREKLFARDTQGPLPTAPAFTESESPVPAQASSSQLASARRTIDA
jgi:hypothetical protein